MRSKSIDIMKSIKIFVEEYYLSHYQSPTTSQIADGVGIARSTAYKYLVEMDHRNMLSYDGKTIKTEIIEQSSTQLIRAAILGNVSCGLPNFAEENIEEYISLPETLFGKGEFYILRARGESMIDIGIEDGDLVVIRKQATANEGEFMTKRKYIITCPVCGKTLFKNQSEIGCAIDVQCPKCGSYLNVKHNDCMLSVKETSFEYEARAK